MRDSFSASDDGVSMPMKTYMKLASTIAFKQLRLVGEVDRGFGVEGERVMVLDLPLAKLAAQGKRLVHVADEVVIDDEDFVAPAELAQGVELGDDLRGRLGARLAAVDGDDVAELALERAAARELHRHGGVLVEAEQIVARHGAGGHVRLVDDAVEALRGSLLERCRDAGEGFFGLADHDVVGILEGAFGVAAGPGAADEGAASERLRADEDVAGMEALRVHGADHDQVGREQIFVANLLEALVHQADLPGGRTERGDGDEAERRGHGGFGQHFEHAFKAPEGGWEARPDHEDVDVAAERREDVVRGAGSEGYSGNRICRERCGQRLVHGSFSERADRWLL